MLLNDLLKNTVRLREFSETEFDHLKYLIIYSAISNEKESFASLLQLPWLLTVAME